MTNDRMVGLALLNAAAVMTLVLGFMVAAGTVAIYSELGLLVAGVVALVAGWLWISMAALVFAFGREVLRG